MRQHGGLVARHSGVAVTYDGTTTTLYIDGVEEASTTGLSPNIQAATTFVGSHGGSGVFFGV